MGFEFKRNWSDETLGRTKDDRTATITYNAKGDNPTQTNWDVQAHPDFPFTVNMPYPGGGTMKCEGWDIATKGFGLWFVTGRFSIPKNGTNHNPGDGDNPLAKPTLYRWQRGIVSAPIDVDLDNNPIVNSSQQALETNEDRRITTLSIIKNFATFDVAQAQVYEGKVNSAPFYGGETDTVLCQTIAPTTDFDLSASFVTVQHTFEYRPISVWGPHPHQTRKIDKGTRAWAGSNGWQRILNAQGRQPAGEVLLDGRGAPKESGIYVPEVGSFSQHSAPAGATVLTYPGAVVLVFQTKKKIDLNGLGI